METMMMTQARTGNRKMELCYKEQNICLNTSITIDDDFWEVVGTHILALN